MKDVIFAENRRMMALFSRFLSETPRGISQEMVRQVADCGVSRSEAMALLLAEACGVDPETERAFYEQRFRAAVRECRAEEYARNFYLQTITFPEKRQGQCRLAQLEYAPCELFVAGDLRRDPVGREIAPLGFFYQGASYPALLCGDRVWMTVTPLEIETMAEPIARARGNVTAFGLGLGYYPLMVVQKDEVTSVTVVEWDAEVIALFEEHILPQFPQRQKLRLVQDDAFHYAQEHLPDSGTDTVFCDLWHDAADGLPAYLRMKALEKGASGIQFDYWIEQTLLLYLENA